MKVNKRILSLILAATLVSTSVVGCGSLDSTATVLTIGGEEVSAGVANFYARYQQSMYESYYMSYFGEDMWGTDFGDGITFQESTKDEIMTTLKELYVIKQHAEELEISISEEEQEAIEAAADEFMAANTDAEYNELASITRENAVEVLSLFTLQAKAEPIIKADIDTDTSEEDVIQKKMTLATYEFAYTNESEEYVVASEEEMGQMLSNLEGLKSLTSGTLFDNATEIGAAVTELTFDASNDMYDLAIITAADELGLNEYSDIIETPDGYHLVQLTDLYDEEATDAKIAEIIVSRENELYITTIDTWIEEAGAEVVNSVWKSVDFKTLGINLPGVTTDTESGVTTYESTYEFGNTDDAEDSDESEEVETTEDTEE